MVIFGHFGGTKTSNICQPFTQDGKYFRYLNEKLNEKLLLFLKIRKVQP